MFDCGFDPATSGTEMQSTDNRKKKTDKKYHGSIVYCQRTRSGKKISSGDGRGFDLTIPKDKLEFRGRTEVSRM